MFFGIAEMHSMWLHGSPGWYRDWQRPSEHGGMIPEAMHSMEFHLIPPSASAQNPHTPSATQSSRALDFPLVKMG